MADVYKKISDFLQSSTFGDNDLLLVSQSGVTKVIKGTTLKGYAEQAGEDAASWSAATINSSGHLILTTAKGTTIDAGNAKGDKGDRGATGATGAKGDKGDTGATGATGAKGDKGDPFTYDDFTPAQLAALKGEKGDKGDTGATGAKGDKGDKGAKGDTGAKGDKGDTGSGFKVLGYYPTVSALSAAVTSPEAGDAYGVGTAEPYDIYIWDGVGNSWVNNGTIQGAKGDKGDQGIAGYTPVKGTDYFTEADKAELVEDVIEALPSWTGGNY